MGKFWRKLSKELQEPSFIITLATFILGILVLGAMMWDYGRNKPFTWQEIGGHVNSFLKNMIPNFFDLLRGIWKGAEAIPK